MAEQHNFVDSRRDPMLNHRLDRGVRCEGEDSRYIDALLIWLTPANMTAGKRYKRNWPRKVTSGLSDCSQAIESAQRSMSIAQRAGKPCRHQPKHPWFLIESFCRRIQFTSPACGGGRRARKSAAGGGSLSPRPVRFAEAPPPQPSPASGRGSAPHRRSNST